MHPLVQGHDLLPSLTGIIASILLPDSEVGQLLGGGGKLSHLLMGDSEPCLFSETVPNVLLAMKELGLFLATDHKGLRTRQDLEARKGKMRVGNMAISYLANRGYDVVQRAQRGG